MIINIDIDNTVNDFIQEFIFFINGISDKTYTLEDFTNYSISKSTGISNEILATLFFRNNNFHEQLDPLDNAIETIRELVECGNTVKFVTSISYDVIQARIDFIRKYFPFINIDTQLIVTESKSSIFADIVIDDCVDHFGNVNDNCKYIIFNQPWNKDIQLDTYNKHKFKRAYDWFDVHAILRDLGAFENE